MSVSRRILPDTGRLQRQAVSLLVLLIVLLGAIDAWAGRGSYGGRDSVSYLDMAKGVADGHLAAAINGVWSPLYPLILSVFIRFAEPDTAKEFVVVRAVNFFIFLATLGFFHVFLQRFLDRWDRQGRAEDAPFVPLARWQLEIAAWAAFMWACFSLDLVSRVGSDGCVIAVVFAALALLLSLSGGKISRARFVGFGILLGIGYWTKTVMLPLSAVFLASALLEPAVRQVRRRLLLSAAALVVVAAPLVIAMSLKYGKLTIGESGTLNYAWHVNRITEWEHWQGGPPGYGSPVHGTRLIFRNPEAFAFGTPISATYAPYYDPAYWYEGVRSHFEWKHQFPAFWRDAKDLARMLLAWAFLVPAIILAVSLSVWRYFAEVVRGFKAFASLWIIGLAGVGIYLPVHIEPRYVAPFLCLILLLLVATVRISRAGMRRGTGVSIALLCLMGALLTCGPRLARATELLIRTRGNVHDSEWRVAEGFINLGLRPGTPVAVIRRRAGRFDSDVWARLAWLRVVAEIPNYVGVRRTGDVDRFWGAPRAVQEAVIQAFAQNGAQFVVALGIPSWADASGWQHIPDTDFFYRPLGSGGTSQKPVAE